MMLILVASDRDIRKEGIVTFVIGTRVHLLIKEK